jgi:uncharacterized protein (UPF0262 family)
MIWALSGVQRVSRSMAEVVKPKNRIASVEIDDSIGTGSMIDEQERRTAIHDLIEDNRFALNNGVEGPYHLVLAYAENRLVFDVRDAGQEHLAAFGLSLAPFRRVVSDYVAICRSYDTAVIAANPAQIETIDMARRGIHNDGSEVLRERLAGKIDLDLDTARRLFTLVCAVLQGA